MFRDTPDAGLSAIRNIYESNCVRTATFHLLSGLDENISSVYTSTVSDGNAWPGWAYGDTFVVYPGENGPLDSIRWEVFFESLKTCALLETLGTEENDEILDCFKSYENFPKDPGWQKIAGTLLSP